MVQARIHGNKPEFVIVCDGRTGKFSAEFDHP